MSINQMKFELQQFSMDSQEEEQAQAMIQQEDVMNSSNNNGDDDDNNIAVMGRKEKRKAMKKMKRKQLRKEIAIKDKQEEEARLNDPQEQIKMARLQQEEAERMEKERIEFEEREKQFLQALELKKLQEEEQLNQCKDSLNIMVNEDNAEEKNEDDGWEYVEEGRAEIIWKGNEIIVKKKKVKVPKRSLEIQKENKESERPISNPLAPQSEAYENHRNAQDILQSVAQQVPNFGTEQDKEHCPFHLKTGACRFGTRCSRVHFYPDKACTLLLKNMYHGLGLAWEQDEGLEYTDEEAEQSFEDFYEDVHTEFLKFGEIVNFKVCRNGSSHLRGNVYVHYKSLESAVFAYQSINGRYFAGKQLTCEFVNVTRWRVAICGEYMKSKLKTCSRGSACNFIHCFRNPCGDYEWADWDKPAPRCWLKSMAALFGYSGDRFTDGDSPGYHSRSSRFRALGSTHEDDGHRRRSLWRHKDDDRKANNCAEVIQGRNDMHQDHHFTKHRKTDDGDRSNGSTDGQRSFIGSKRSSKKRGREPDPIEQDSKCGEGDAISAKNDSVERGVSDRYLGHNSRSSNQQKRAAESAHEHCQKKDDTHAQENTCAEKHYNRFHKHKGKYFLQEREGLDSSNIEAHHDSLDSEEDEHYRHSRKNRRRMKNEADLSSTASDEDGLCRVKDRSQKTRRKSSKSKSKRSVTIRSDEDGLDCCEDRQHRFVEKNSRLKTNIKESFDGRDRLGRGEKRQRKVLSLKDQSVTDMESDRDEARRHRHRKKHSRQSKHDADSSESAFESDRSGRYERRPQKRSTSFKSCKESDVTDLASSREKGVGEERRRRHRSSAKHHMKVRGSSKIDSNADSRFKVRDTAEDKDEADGGNFDTYVRSRSSCADLDQNHPVQESIDYQGGILSRFSDTEKCNDSIDGVLVCRRDIKRCGKDHMLQSNKSDEGANVSTEAETCSVPTIYQDFDADTEAEHEKACRHAALKKLEEKKKNMDSQAVHGRESVESFRFCSHEHTVAMESGSSKLGTNVASIQRRRI